ncbi:Predicted metal-dependent phosphoesterase TrpH, contains PHP domain [Duganella sacchari]|uniref:Predicted metal-dependent phosphoesterase TrpH, contains PHP domain n=1 Tax=Duganella sacchari TaxID=551987 RepID=A0A1M7QA65_9BURK|nr:S-layer protein [Duganella sacchari]SHN27246.1 Predicted metal-dependent phosphoesterase TrpH, contains PHP domain [Duganella sacchari]
MLHNKFMIPSAIAIMLTVAACGGDSEPASVAPPLPAGRWIAGDLHTHTTQSADADVSQTLEKILAKAFSSYGLDWMAVSNHLRVSTRDEKGIALAASIPMSVGAERYEIPRVQALQAAGTYADKLIFSGFEWDMPTHDHIGIGLFEGTDKLSSSTKGMKEFEYLFTTRDAAMFDAADVAAWKAKYGETRYNKTADDALQAINWLKQNYPNTSYAVINHPSRNKGSYSIADFRAFNDAAPNIMFAIEGMVGNQMEPDRGGYTAAYTDDNALLRVYGGVDYIVAKLGGPWDALLGEGRRIWNLTDSDTHFKIVGGNSSGYFPGEYAKNYVFNSATGQPVAKDLLAGLRSGKMFSVYGDLINALDFNLASEDDRKEMGGELKVASGDKVTITIRFKTPARNNYEKPVDSGTPVNVKPVVDHVDLIVGDVGAKATPGTAAYSVATNASTRVVKRFSSADWKVDADGYYSVTYETTASKNQYFRLRGTNLGTDVAGLTQGGEPLADQRTGTTDNTQRFNDINDRNYRSLWFYSNPVFVTLR